MSDAPTPRPGEGTPGAPPPPPPPPYGSAPAPGAYGAPPAGGGYAGPGVLAEWPQRALGGLIDWFGPSIVASFIYVISHPLGLILDVAVLAWGLYNAYLNGQTGKSYGKQVVGLKVVKEADGQLIGGGLGIARGFLHIIDSVICYLGFLLPLVDSKKQTIADKILGTVVIVDKTS